MGQYRKAVLHFERALQFNAGDDFANGYLFYCYLYSERFEDAKLLTRHFSTQLTNAYHIQKMSSIDFANIESGIKAADSSRQFKNAFFSSLALGHSISNRVFLQHGLTAYSQDEQRFRVQQLQYYLKASLPLGHGLLFSAAIHAVNVGADVRSFVTTVITNTALVYPIAPPNMSPPPPQQLTYTSAVVTEKINHSNDLNTIAAVTLCKRGVYADYSIGATIASFDTTSQVQLNLGATVYPLKNNRLAIGAAAYLHSEKKGGQKHLAFAPVISIYPSRKLNLALSYFNNQGPNISENTGAFVSNSIDYTRQRISLTASIGLTPGLWFYGTWGYEQKTQRSAGYKYDYNIFVVGLKMIPQLN